MHKTHVQILAKALEFITLMKNILDFFESPPQEKQLYVCTNLRNYVIFKILLL